MTLDTKALPNAPESSAEIAALREDGWRVTGRSHGTVRLARTVGDVATPTAEPLQDAVAGDSASLPLASGPVREAPGDAARAEMVAELGVRVADALSGHGFHSLQHARTAYAEAPDAFAGLSGIGPATLRRLSAETTA